MKVVILAGGRGSRLGEVTNVIPKPMVKIGDKPILQHIMDIYARQLDCEFLIACGYLIEVIKDWLVSVDLPYSAKVINTGANTETGWRVARIRCLLNERFMLTYGDGLANIDLGALLRHHEEQSAVCTMTAVHPPPRWGEAVIVNGMVSAFREKPLEQAWINGGFFVCEPSALGWIRGNEPWESGALVRMAEQGYLAGYQHHGFWACMDTPADYERLTKLEREGAPWMV